MMRNAIDRYLVKFGKDGAFIHGAFAALALLVDPSLALGLVTTSFRSSKITVPLTLLWAGWLHYQALALSPDISLATEGLFSPTSPILVTLASFVSGILLRVVVEGRVSRNAIVVAGVLAAVLLVQGRGGLDEFQSRAVAESVDQSARFMTMMRVFSNVSEIMHKKGVNSPEAVSATYVWQRHMWTIMNQNGVSDYESYLSYRQQKQSDSELFYKMRALGKEADWKKLNAHQSDDPSYPDRDKS